MSAERSAPGPQLSSLDAAATIALCQTLAEYGEAGGLSRDLMLQVGGYASSRYAANVDVLLAAARMYRLGGEPKLARDALVRAGKLAPEDGRTLGLLDEVLHTLGEPGPPSRVIEEAADEVAPSHSNPRIQAIAGEAAASPASPPSPRRGPSQFPTKEMTASQKLETLASGFPIPSFDEPEATSTPIGVLRRRTVSSGTQRAVVAAANMTTQPILRTPGPSPSARSSAGHRAVEARARPFDEPADPHGRDVERSQVQPARESRPSGRPPEGARVPDSKPKESVRPPESLRPPRASRIKMLDLDDPRRRLDRYELVGEIASGGMATVFLARRDGAGGFQRFVAIKRLHPHFAHQDQFVEMFLDEARLAAGIHHPHVVPILEVGESENGYYLVMEFIEGDTLAGLTARALARGVVLPRTVAVRIVLDTLAGLHAAQQLKDDEGRLLGLVHRDCTPQNILVGVDGSSRITDFGVARAAARLAITRPQTVKGKVAYLSPEQATAGELDRRSDLFTVGIVLWEVIAGRPLFLADTDVSTIARLLTNPIPSLRQYAPDVPPDLEEVCLRALQRNASRRYPTAAAMAEALENAARHSVGGIASPAEVGRCVEMLMGSELVAQREAIRAWLAQTAQESGPESRRSRSDVPSGIRHMAPLEIPGPPRLPQPSNPDDALGPPSSRRTPHAPSPSPSAPASGETSSVVESAAVVPAPSKPVKPPGPSLAQRATALLKPDLGGRSPRTLVLVALILFVGVSSPLWMKRLDRVRQKLSHRRAPSAQHATPAPKPPPVPTAEATAEPQDTPVTE